MSYFPLIFLLLVISYILAIIYLVVNISCYVLAIMYIQAFGVIVVNENSGYWVIKYVLMYKLYEAIKAMRVQVVYVNNYFHILNSTHKADVYTIDDKR